MASRHQNIRLTDDSNSQFAAFVAATGYVTVAERKPDPAQHADIDPAQLVPGSAVFVTPREPTAEMSWWRFVPGANWRAPLWPGSSSLNGARKAQNHAVSLVSEQDRTD